MKLPEFLLPQVTRTIDREGFFPTASKRAVTHVLVALSGGVDSTALLLVLSQLQRRYKLRLTALYVNHGLRAPAILRQEEAHCLKLGKQIGVPCIVARRDVRQLATERKISVETAGRLARYELLAETAAEISADLIATGHHRDDQLETIFFRLLRGGWFESLAGIPYRRGDIIRPFLDCRKSELIRFVKACRVRVRYDSSNSNRLFTRNKIRLDLLPPLVAELPGLEDSLLGLAVEAGKLAQRNDKAIQSFLARHAALTPGGKLVVDRQRFTRLDATMQCYLAREAVQRVSGPFQPVSVAHMQQVVALASESIPVSEMRTRVEKRIMITDGMQVVRLTAKEILPRADDLLVFIPRASRKGQNRYQQQSELIYGVVTDLFDGRVKFSARLSTSIRVPKNRTLARIDFAHISPPLVVRRWQEGDRFRPLGLMGTKKVGDYLTDRKIPAMLRDEQLVVADQTGIVWLVGRTIDERVKISSKTTKTLFLSFRAKSKHVVSEGDES